MNKNILILLAIFCATNNLYSQDIIDPSPLPQTFWSQRTLNFNDTNVFRKSFSDFVIGWNYGSKGRQLDELMDTNFYLGNIYTI